jgi:restriction endonuclease S subunit
MIVGIAHLFTQVKENIAKQRNIQINGYVDSTEVSCVNNRAALICTLEALLLEHRKKYATRFNGLHGKAALHHKLLLKYQWPLSTIRELTFPDILLSLQDELRVETLPEDIRRYLSQVTISQYPVNFADYPESEWDPELAERLLVDIEK